MGADASGQVCIITRQLFDNLIGLWMKQQSATFTQCLFNCPIFPSFHFSSSASLIAPFRSFTHQHLTPSHMCKKHKDELIHVHVHPPFPSFAWVMTTRANPPTHAYAYGYIRSAQARPRLLVQRATPPGRDRPYARSSRSPPSLPRATIESCDEKFMVGRSTIDFLVAWGGRELNAYPLRFRKR
jgi:hypothetical protein